MKTHDRSVQESHHILDVLMLLDGDATVAALYSALREFWDYPPVVNAEHLLDSIDAAERRGWLSVLQESRDGEHRPPTEADRMRAKARYGSWLPDADDLSWDPIGLWCRITDLGRAEWQRWAEAEGVELTEPWRLQQFSAEHKIRVWAAEMDAASRILKSWLSSHPEVELVGSSKTVRPVASLELAGGRTLENGVEVAYRYRDRSPTARAAPVRRDHP